MNERVGSARGNLAGNAMAGAPRPEPRIFSQICGLEMLIGQLREAGHRLESAYNRLVTPPPQDPGANKSTPVAMVQPTTAEGRLDGVTKDLAHLVDRAHQLATAFEQAV